jgi:complement component 1 Q subcomponent-binding protein
MMQLRFASKEAKLSITDELTKEIEFEEGNKEVDTEYEDAKKITLEHFKLHEKPGSGVVRLTRKHKDEQIEVRFDVQDSNEEELDGEADYGQGDDDNNEDQVVGEDVGVNFEVTITKGDKKVIVTAVGGQSLQVLGMRVLSKNATPSDEEDVYSGPAFDELQEELQEAFYDWLEERKIDGDLAFFVLAHARVKEQMEYEHWLNELRDFTDEGN